VACHMSEAIFLMAYTSMCSDGSCILKCTRTVFKNDTLVSYVLVLC
jgi:hypothetical protein